MVYTNKTYISFDADSDINYYYLMKAWKENEAIDFNFYDAHNINNITDRASEFTIKKKLAERMNNTKLFILLVGAHTKYLYKYVKREIEEAKRRDIPIIIVNLNGNRSVDNINCPPCALDCLALHISFNKSIIFKAINEWPLLNLECKKNGMQGGVYYKKNVYQQLGL